MMKTQQETVEKLLRRWSYSSESSEEEAIRSRTTWRIAYGYWMRFARALGKANALLLLTIVYVVMIGPAAIVLKILGKDLLDRKANENHTFWRDKVQEPFTIERGKQPF